MRIVPPPVQASLDTDLGTEPIILVEVEWVAGSPILYSDQKIDGADYPHPTILSMGGFDTSMMLSGASDTLQLQMTLDDVDGYLKTIYLANDVHKRPAKVYFTYKGLNLADKMLLFTGEVVTPFQWDEGKRSLQFTLLSKLEDTEVGFSMEEGDFPNIPEEALGKAWPLVFGQVCHIPAVQIRASRQGYLLSGEGIHDFTLHPRICQATKISCPTVGAGNEDVLSQGADNIWGVVKTRKFAPDMECVNRRFGEICKLNDLLNQQMAYENETLSIYNGVSFPQGETITLSVDGAEFTGMFSGNTFAITTRKHPDYDTFNHVQCVTIGDRAYGSVAGRVTPEWRQSASGTACTYDGSETQAIEDCSAALTRTTAATGGPSASWKAYEDMESSSFVWLESGSEVFMIGESEVLYVASLLPGVVNKVAAYRDVGAGKRLLIEVPPENYTVYETDYDGYTVVEIGLKNRLSVTDEKFGDQIYVSFTSTVGPNVADIIQWLIEKYTDLTVDATTFASVKASTTKYPCNFYLLDRRSVYQVVQDLAYQSRCSVYIRNKVVYLVYLSAEPTSVRTITESDIVLGTFIESLTNTDDIATTHKITFQKAGARVRSEDSIDFKINLKYNVGKYGTSIEEWDYYTQNTFDTILKSSTFWLIRKAASWKKLQFDLPVKHIDLDVNDAITVDVAQFSSTPIKCVIESAMYDPDRNTVSVVCWTPLRSGELSEYYWAWPSQKTATATWPLPGDTNGGGGYTFNVIPPVGHILLGGATNEDQLTITTGDKNPSDLDDTLPVVSCLVSDLIDFNQDPPEIVALQLAQSNNRSAIDRYLGGGTSGGDEDEKENGQCGFPRGGGCGYKVTVVRHMSLSQGHGQVPCGPNGRYTGGGPCGCSSGCPSCTGAFFSMCYTYGSLFFATFARSYFDSQGKALADNWSCNEIQVVKGFTSVANGRKTDPVTHEACADIPPGMGPSGEVATPTGSSGPAE